MNFENNVVNLFVKVAAENSEMSWVADHKTNNQQKPKTC